ncbi:MAG: protein-L-isoaspartate(D-aspartate) O-methyltransferase [Gammaproteobacteria bacterium]
MLASLLFAVSAQVSADSETQFSEARAELVSTIETRVRDASNYLGKSYLDPRVIAAMGDVPRHEFVPVKLRGAAYENRPLPIGYQQTISQPSLVAMMTDLLQLPDACHVLEVGTGSGYQAAILGELCAKVYTIEIVEPLGQQAKNLLGELGYENVHVRVGDGYAGWPEHAPYDGVIVTAAVNEPPAPLVEQLRPGGRMVIPLGQRRGYQELVVIEKRADGSVSERKIFPVRFVPFTRDQ